MNDVKWFEGSELNFAENLLKFRDHNTAIISSREDKPTIRISYEELYGYTASCARGLKDLGVKKGDRIAGFISNIPEAIIGMLAATSIGAIWSSCFSRFWSAGDTRQVRPDKTENFICRGKLPVQRKGNRLQRKNRNDKSQYP